MSLFNLASEAADAQWYLDRENAILSFATDTASAQYDRVFDTMDEKDEKRLGEKGGTGALIAM